MPHRNVKAETSKPAATKASAHAPKSAETKAPAAKTAPAASKPASEAAAAVTKAAPAAVKPAQAASKPASEAAATITKAAPAAAAPAAATVVQAAKTTTETLNEGTKIMKNEATQVADRVQAVFGDVNERAKTAIERNSRFAEEMTELGKGNIEAMVASTKVAAKGVETLGQEVAEFSRKSFEDASAAIRSFAEVKSPTDLFRLQSEFARTQFDSMISESSKLSETMIKLAGDIAQPLTNRYSVAAERVKNVVAN